MAKDSKNKAIKKHKSGNWPSRDDHGGSKGKSIRRKAEKRIERGEGYGE